MKKMPKYYEYFHPYTQVSSTGKKEILKVQGYKKVSPFKIPPIDMIKTLYERKTEESVFLVFCFLNFVYNP